MRPTAPLRPSPHSQRRNVYATGARCALWRVPRGEYQNPPHILIFAFQKKKKKKKKMIFNWL
jgi:hypothetical protein